MTPGKELPQDLVLDLTSFQLIRAGQPVKLEKNPMELLALLVRRQGALVTRQEIVSAIWGDDVHIDAGAGINTAIRKIRQALDDNSTSPRYLETVVGKGYRFIGPISVVSNEVLAGNDVLATPTASTPGGLPGWGIRTVVLVAKGFVAILLLAVTVIDRDSSAVSPRPRFRFYS